MSKNAWIYQYHRSASPEQKKLSQPFFDYLDLPEASPAALDLVTQARDHAAAQGEAWWKMLYQQMRLNELAYTFKDYAQVEEEAIAAIVEMRDPAYNAFPQKVCLQEKLLDVYLERDPVFYAEQINQGVDEMDRLLPSTMRSCHFCVASKRYEMARFTGDVPEAQEHAEKFMSMTSDTFPYHRPIGYLFLCQIAADQGHWKSTARWGALMTNDNPNPTISVRTGKPILIEDHHMASGAIWRALAAYHLGNLKEANRHFEDALRYAEDNVQLGYLYYEPLAAYYEVIGNFEAALSLLQERIQAYATSKRLYKSAETWLDYCRLLAKTNQLTEQTRHEAENVIQQLPHATTMLTALNKLENTNSIQQEPKPPSLPKQPDPLPDQVTPTPVPVTISRLLIALSVGIGLALLLYFLI